MVDSKEIYLDNNATTRPIPEVVERVVELMTSQYGNPSSVHQRGIRTRDALLRARESVALLVGASEEQVVFTSGGTEANNLALNKVAITDAKHLVTTETEHSSVLNKAGALQKQGAKVTYLRVDGMGRISPQVLKTVISDQVDLVSIHWVNNETGVIQPIEELGEICRNNRVKFHVDAAQAVGKVPIDFSDLPVDILTFSAHKIHGPQGVGALCFRNIEDVTPVFFGGDQERVIRPGTENLPGIAGFGEAAAVRQRDFSDATKHMENLRDVFEQRLMEALPDVLVNGAPSYRVCNTSNIRFPGIDGMALMARLDIGGVICSQTSACKSQRPEPSHVLLAMGLSEEEAFTSVRFSFSALNTSDEAEAAADRVANLYGKLLAFGCSEV